MKTKYIDNEIWLLSRLGAFQRVKIYRSDAKAKDKREFNEALKNQLNQLLKSEYFQEVPEEKHVDNIQNLSEFTKQFDKVLINGLNFGVSQKLLNLYLKYHWCLDRIPTPPHFPVDSIIQNKLGLKVIPWTKMVGEKGKEEYLKIIASAKLQLKDSPFSNIAELELKLFERN